MNLFGLDIKFAKGDNGVKDSNNYVRREDCQVLHRDADDKNRERYGNLEKRIEDLKGHVDTRFDDLRDLVRRRTNGG